MGIDWFQCAIWCAFSLATTSNAYGATKASAIYDLILASHFCEDAIVMSDLGSQMKRKSELDADAPRALSAAGKNKELRAAVKEFYVAAAAFCDNPSESLKGNVAEKESALTLELKAAGL